MATSQQVSREAFLSRLRRSGLLASNDLAGVVERLPETPRGRVVARSLVDMGLLTRFQAEQLLAGRSHGFFLGQYRILEEIGKGGMGRVFKALHQSLNRVVALKVLNPRYGSTERARQLFFREMRAIAQLTHANIVTAYDAGQIDGRAYLVMEYVDGPNLEQMVRRCGPLDIGQACEVVRQTALGLQYAHERGMVHRDIKPGNLLVARDSGPVKILDFGLARLHEPQPLDLPQGDSIVGQENVVLGTPDYVSPEQARHLRSADIRSDLYSLGCTFYYLLAGRVPFSGGTVLEKLLRHTTATAVPITQRRPEVPAGVAAVVERLMAKQPEARFQEPKELAAALAPFARPLSWSGLDNLPPAPPPPAEEPDSEPPSWIDGSSIDILTDVSGSTISPQCTLSQDSVGPPKRIHPHLAHDPPQRLLLALAVGIGVVAGLVALLAFLWGR